VSRLLTIGETMGVAVTETGDPLRTARSLRLSTAGAESTVAIGLRRLGHEAAWVGVVGQDELGARVLRDLSAEGVDVRYARVDPTRPTGFMLRELRTAEYTKVSYYRNGSSGSQLSVPDVEAAFTAAEESGTPIDLVHLTGITPALGPHCAGAVLHAVKLAHAAGAPVSFDVNYRSTLPGSAELPSVLHELLPRIDLLFVGEDELAHVTDEAEPGRAVRDLLERGPTEVVIKRGAAGALAAAAPDWTIVTQRAPSVRVIDAIGAGDGFTAGYLAALLDGLPLADRLRWATAAAAYTVGTHGDWEGLPTRADLHRHTGGDSVTVR
jgi:2-dehydro-3-deoxygluconokinase